MMWGCRTAAYMSPSQLHVRNDEDGYLGTAGDVWAAGVLLVVLLLGATLHPCAYLSYCNIYEICVSVRVVQL